MIRLVSSGLAFLAGMVFLPTGVSLQQTQQHPAPEYRNDPRLSRLKSFFSRAGCPAAAYARIFLEAADDYALDWRLLPSISFLESTGGKAAPRNNIFGWNSGRAAFESPQAAIHEVGYTLAHSRLYRDKDLDSLLTTYNSDPSYADRVKWVMRRISPSE